MHIFIQLHDVEDNPCQESISRTGRIYNLDIVCAGQVGILIDLSIAAPVGSGNDNHLSAVF